MRLWSIHPAYLDPQGLVALWREGLLARKVLKGETRGYRNHPQLIRFAGTIDPVSMINAYLHNVYGEAASRGYNFDASKLEPPVPGAIRTIDVHSGQVEYEFLLLQKKLRERNMEKYSMNASITRVEVNGIFRIVEGGIEEWERVKPVL